MDFSRVLEEMKNDCSRDCSLNLLSRAPVWGFFYWQNKHSNRCKSCAILVQKELHRNLAFNIRLYAEMYSLCGIFEWKMNPHAAMLLWLNSFVHWICYFSCEDPPMVTLSIEPRSVLEGERVTFTCQATANPPIMGYRSEFMFWMIFQVKVDKNVLVWYFMILFWPMKMIEIMNNHLNHMLVVGLQYCIQYVKRGQTSWLTAEPNMWLREQASRQVTDTLAPRPDQFYTLSGAKWGHQHKTAVPAARIFCLVIFAHTIICLQASIFINVSNYSTKPFIMLSSECVPLFNVVSMFCLRAAVEHQEPDCNFV